MDDFDNYPDKTSKPFWNDGDKVASMAATIVILALALLILAGIVKLIFWMF